MLLIKNKKAYYDYQLDKKYVAGIVLSVMGSWKIATHGLIRGTKGERNER